MRLGGPGIVLVEPQLGENVGMAARAMLNCGLGDLRLVRPRDGWPNRTAESAAAGADMVVRRARVFATTEAAVAEVRRLYATTIRARDLAKPVLSARQAAAELRAAEAEGHKTAVLFGPERAGLTNEDVALADAIIQVPLNPAFASLNLAQAVLIVGYEWLQAGAQAPKRVRRARAGRPATKDELVTFFARLEGALDDAGFLRPVEKRPAMVHNLRTLFTRAGLSEREVRTLHGIVSALAPRRGGGGREGAA